MNSFVSALPREERVPGGVALIPLPAELTHAQPEVFFHDKPVALIRKPSHYVAMIGLDLKLAPGTYHLSAKTKERTLNIPFEVATKKYPSEAIVLPKHKKPSPERAKDPQLLARMERERKALGSALNHYQPTQPLSDMHFKNPIEGRVSSPFGFHRTYDGVPGGSHRGIDLAAPMKTPIYNAFAGKVTLAESLLLTGKTVVLDHGQGFTTVYCHLDHISVKTGQHLHQHDKIGLVGQTGRATGPHLHFGVSLNGARVNPALFLPLTKTPKSNDKHSAS